MKKILTNSKNQTVLNFAISLFFISGISAQTSSTNKSLFAPSMFRLNFTSDREVFKQMEERYTLDATLVVSGVIFGISTNQYEKKQELKWLQFDSKGYLIKKIDCLQQRLNSAVHFIDSSILKCITKKSILDENHKILKKMHFINFISLSSYK
ncbi:hypothetical protein ACFQZF_07200 [Flavobacterium myungsuense]|uniref:Uncharacterized protein n=1 Tax=Flavobacterium myungsuense TaxID=651823 RepID=A0ABW3J2T9_9FLAO